MNRRGFLAGLFAAPVVALLPDVLRPTLLEGLLRKERALRDFVGFNFDDLSVWEKRILKEGRLLLHMRADAAWLLAPRPDGGFAATRFLR